MTSIDKFLRSLTFTTYEFEHAIYFCYWLLLLIIDYVLKGIKSEQLQWRFKEKINRASFFFLKRTAKENCDDKDQLNF